MYQKEPDLEFMYAFDFDKEEWETASTESPLYTRDLISFGGAIYAWDLNFNLYKFENKKWDKLEVTGNTPAESNFSAVAIHESSAFCMFSNSYYTESFVYIFELNVKSKTWNQIYVQGSILPRGLQDSACAVIDNKIYAHGGYVGGSYISDLYCFDLCTRQWSKVGDSQPTPAVAGHTMISWNSKLVMFGGYYFQSVKGKYYNDVWICDVNENKMHKKLYFLLHISKLVDVQFN